MRIAVRDLAEAVGGRFVGDPSSGGRDPHFDGASIDSRSLRSGQLFVAVTADRDGHDYVRAAEAAGAAAALVSRHVDAALPQVVVDDSGVALLDAGRLARARLGVPVVGITGSVGKTTTKDLLSSILSTRMTVAASARSHNNELGVPITLLDSPLDAGVVVVEMGARGAGHIRLLCDVASPTIGVVTAVAAAHTELFGSIDAVARAKGELVEALPPTGTAVLSTDPLVSAMASRTTARVVTFGDGGDVCAEDVTLDASLRPSFTLRSPLGSIEVVLGLAGRHQISNALAAAAAALEYGVDLAAVAEGLADPIVSPWRMELSRTAGGVVVINDAYNANPTSTTAALRALADLRLGELRTARRVAVLGVMAELGDDEAAGHLEAAALASRLGIEVIGVGTDLYGVPAVDVADAIALARSLDEGDALLVKGSRVAGLERVARSVLELVDE
jgi:UDP-N-acetylmuramoyl-tripeptide--D-alanyl-D-alanine ligase